jgi:profilin
MRIPLQGREGIIIVKTVQAILISHYPDTVQPGAATVSVEHLADYLIGLGY